MDELLVAERLAYEADRPGLEHAAARPIVCKGSNEDDGNPPTFRLQAILQLDAAQAFHLDIDDQAARAVRVRA